MNRNRIVCTFVNGANTPDSHGRKRISKGKKIGEKRVLSNICFPFHPLPPLPNIRKNQTAKKGGEEEKRNIREKENHLEKVGKKKEKKPGGWPVEKKK